MKRDSCAKCGAIAKWSEAAGKFLCGSCEFDETFEPSGGDARALYRKYGEASTEAAKSPADGGAA